LLCCQQLGDHSVYLWQRADGGRQRIEHDRVVDRLAIAAEDRRLLAFMGVTGEVRLER